MACSTTTVISRRYFGAQQHARRIEVVNLQPHVMNCGDRKLGLLAGRDMSAVLERVLPRCKPSWRGGRIRLIESVPYGVYAGLACVRTYWALPGKWSSEHAR